VFEPHRTGSKTLNNVIYSGISIKQFFCKGFGFSCKDFLETACEVKPDGTRKVVFEAGQIINDPFMLVGSNL
jgi:hypothetical protein